MKRPARYPRTPSNLSEFCNRRFAMYAVAAGAAGLGLLTVAPPAEGRIVYTPANMPLMNQDGVLLDLNHDGVSDFSFNGTAVSNRSVSTFFFRLTVSPAQQGNAIWGIESHEHCFLRCFSAALHPGRTETTISGESRRPI